MCSFLQVSLSTILSLTLLRGVQAENITPPEPEITTPATQQQVHKLLTGLPLSFIPNQGQADKQIKYSLHGRDTQVYFTAKGLTLVLTEPEKKDVPRREASLKAVPQVSEPRPRWVTKLDFVGARRAVKPEGIERSEAVVSYFKGNEDQWRTGVPTYGKVVYREVWPGIDVEYSGTGQKLKTSQTGCRSQADSPGLSRREQAGTDGQWATQHSHAGADTHRRYALQLPRDQRQAGGGAQCVSVAAARLSDYAGVPVWV